MKSKLSILFFAIVAMMFVACESDDNEEQPLNNTYVGRFEVASPSPALPPYAEDNSKFEIVMNKNKTLSLTMYDIKFNEKMPVRLNIAASNIAYTENDGNITASVDSIVPTVAGVPMEKYILYNLEIGLDDDNLDVDFKCIGFDVDYDGVLKK